MVVYLLNYLHIPNIYNLITLFAHLISYSNQSKCTLSSKFYLNAFSNVFYNKITKSSLISG